ncbi:MAG: hypothetical protein O7J95_12440 [Planctomycetota bacterium]|nr:hypothetical protein [Planctomycetota bacterium]
MKFLPVLALAALPAALAAGCSRGASAAAFGRLEVTVVDEEMQPIAGVYVSLDGRGACSGVSSPSQETGWDGRVVWELEEPCSGKLRLVDPASRYVSRVVPFERLSSASVEMRRGAELRLEIKASGNVQPASLRVWSADRSEGRAMRSSTTGETVVGPLAPGPVKIFISAAGYTTRVLDVTLPRKGLDLGDVELLPGGSVLTGRVDPDLEVRPSEAYLRFAGAGQGVAVGPDGRFEFRGLPEMAATLVLRRGRRELFSKELVIDRGRIDLGTVRPEGPGG